MKAGETDCIATRESYRSACGGRGRRIGCVAGAGGGAKLGCGVPIGAFQGFDGVAAGAGAGAGAAPGITNGVVGGVDGPGAGTAISPAAAAAAIAGSSS